MKGALRFLGVAGLAVGVLAYPVAFAIDRAAGVEVRVVAAADPSVVEVNRGLWELDGSPKDRVPALYGTPSEKPIRVVCAKEGTLLHPKEDPSLSLYILKEGDHPLQSQTLYYFALLATLGGVVVGGALLLLGCRKCRKGADEVPASSEVVGD